MKAKVKPRRLLMNHREAATLASISPETLRDWVGKGVWPLPHAIIERTWFYKCDVIEAWLDTGEWPAEARFRAGEGKGRVADR